MGGAVRTDVAHEGTDATGDRSKTVSERVIEAVAEREGVDTTGLRTPLYDAVDPDALDALFAASDESGTAERRLRFTYHGYDVIVGGDGAITVSEAGNDVASTNPET